jgi:hypothetical protein
VENFARQFAEHLAAIHSVGDSHPDLAFLPELPTACPAAADDDLFYAGVADVTAFWAYEGVYGLVCEVMS